MDELAADGLAFGRGRRLRLRIALFVAACAVGGLLSTTVPDLTANRDLVLFYYLPFVAAVLVLLSVVAARD